MSRQVDFQITADVALPLVQTTRSNVLAYSQDFTQTAWTKLNSTVAANAATAPDGSNTATALTDNVTVGLHSVYANVSAQNWQNVPCALSVYAKAGSWSKLRLRHNTSGGEINGYFDLSAGLVTSQGGGMGAPPAYATIAPVGNGWYRCAVIGGVQGLMYYPEIHLDATPNNGTSTIYIWGAQYELGSFATQYLPTAGAAVSVPDYFHGTDFLFVTNAGGAPINVSPSPGSTFQSQFPSPYPLPAGKSARFDFFPGGNFWSVTQVML